MENQFLRQEYLSRINRVIDHIDRNISSELKAEELADVACFSRFHFHRIFSALVGETLNQFIQRIRIEKAASLLIASPKKSITEIAFDCGFSGSATFARAFKEIYGMSASQWRGGGYAEFSKNRKMDSNIRQTDSNSGKEFDIANYYIDGVTNNKTRRNAVKTTEKLDAKIEVKEFPEMTVAYVRHIGPYAGDEKLFKGLFYKLFKWAGPRGLLNSPDLKVLSVYHDNPEITDEKNLRTSVCLTVPDSTEVDGDIGKMKIAGGTYAVGHFELNVDQYAAAWNTLCGDWLPDSGYQPDDKPPFELSLNNPKEHPEGKCVVDICVPVKPL